jgi:PTS system nitrogen regulatory IIA component
MSNPEQIMTLAEVAQYLKIADKSVLRMVRRGELPGTKIASQWRFFRSLIDDWLLARMQPHTAAHHDASSKDAGLEHMLERASCLLDIIPGNKLEIIAQLATPLAALEGRSRPEQLIERLMAREKMVSTGIGNGIAIPHIRNPLELLPKRPRLVFARCKRGVDFDAIDGKPVTLFFLPRPSNEIHHVKVMARLASLLNAEANRTALQQAECYAQVRDILIKHNRINHTAT